MSKHSNNLQTPARNIRRSLPFLVLPMLLLLVFANALLTTNASPLTILTREISPEVEANKLLASFPDGLDDIQEQHIREARFFGRR